MGRQGALPAATASELRDFVLSFLAAFMISFIFVVCWPFALLKLFCSVP